MVYQWKTGSRISVDPQTAGSVCEALEAENRLTAKNLLEVSRPVDAPLYGEFTWDDADAAELWREQEARHIINCLVIKTDSNALPVRGFFNIERTNGEYLSVITILKSEDTRKSLLDSAMTELQAFQNKYNSISELTKVFTAIDETKRDLKNGR